MNTRKQGPAPRRDGTTRDGFREVPTFLGHRLSGWFAALAFLVFSLSSVALAQTVPAPMPSQQTITVPPGFVEQLQQSLQNDSDPATPTLAGDCQVPPGFTCVEIPDVMNIRVPVATPVADTATEDQALRALSESFVRLRRHTAGAIRRFRAQVDQVQRELVQTNYRVDVVRIQFRTLNGCTPQMSDQDCLVVAANRQRYWDEIQPAREAAFRVEVAEADAQAQSDIAGMRADLAALRTSYEELREQVGQLQARMTANERLDTQQTTDIHALQQGRGRQWLGPQAGILSTSCPSDHNCWTGVTAGFGYAGRPMADLPFGVSGGIDLGYLWGRSGAYSSFLIRARGAIGWQSMSNTFGFGFGGQFLALLTAQTDGGAAFIGGGPVATAWWKPTSWLRLIGEVGGMFGTVRVAGTAEATGHGEDHSAFTFGAFAEIPISGF